MPKVSCAKVSRASTSPMLASMLAEPTVAKLREEAPRDSYAASARVERWTDCRATESFESLHIRIRSKFCQNSGNILTILQKFWEFSFWDFSNFSIMFGEIPRKKNPRKIIKIGSKLHESSSLLSKNNEFCRNSNKNTKKVWRIFANILNLEHCEGV